MSVARNAARRRLTEVREATRRRLTKVVQAELDAALIDLTRRYHPITVRGVFYRAEVSIPHIVLKDEKGYGLVQRRLVELRKRGDVEYSWITDGTRWRHGHTRYASLQDFQVRAAALYRLDYWVNSNVHVEIWIEKDALAGVIAPVVIDEWGLDLMVSRGFSSKTYLYEAGQFLRQVDKETHVYVLSDFDPSGKCAARKVEEGLREFAPDVDLHVHELAVTVDQIRDWDLPTRPTKMSDSRARKFVAEYGEESVELDAIPPDLFRRLVGDAIAAHADPRAIDRLKDVEWQERETIRSWGDIRDDEDEEDDED
jgi:hypothetical protein